MAESTNGASSAVSSPLIGLTPLQSSIMEKIRAKASTYKPWPELVKLAKTTLVDKRNLHLIRDPSDRPQLEKCLDTIQRSIKVKGLRSMIDRLETITRQLSHHNLKFTSGPTGRDCFISSDMFYVEVVLDPSSGFVSDVKVAHQGEPISCSELTQVLRDGDFASFTQHLEGLSSIYQLNADSKTKSKGYLALHSLETDLTILAQLQASTATDVSNMIHKTPVGVLEGRKGGHPLKLTFFVSPYNLIDRKTKSSIPLSIETVMKNKLGYSATVSIESSNRNHKLQTTSLISISKSNEGKSLPQFAASSNLNSSSLPACFMLKLQKALPTSLEIMKKISGVTGIDLLSSQESNGSLEPTTCLVSLIAKGILCEKDKKKLETSMNSTTDINFYVKLPDQQHSYFVHQLAGSSPDSSSHLSAQPLTSIPFTHPTHVPQILVFLRQQVLFNVIMGSCIRKLSSFQTNDPTFTFEVTASSMTNISVSFEHPVEESLASLEIDLKDVTSVKCKLYPASSFSSLCPDDFVSRILQRCMSIPVTLRMVIVKSKERALILKEQEIKAKQQQEHQQSFPGTGSDSMTGNIGGTSSYPTSDQLDSTISSILSQQFTSSSAGRSSDQMKGVASGMAASLLLMSQSSSLTPAQKASILQNLQYQQQQQQMRSQGMMSQQQLQSQRQMMNASPGDLSSSQQQRQQLHSKQNAMLLNMLSDVPSANQSQTAMIQQLYQQQLLLQQQQQLLSSGGDESRKKGRKRKLTEPSLPSPSSGSRSPASSSLPGRSPKRKYSQDADESGDGFGSSLLRPPSRPSSASSSSGHEMTARKTLEQLLHASNQDPVNAAAALQSMIQTGQFDSTLANLPTDLIAKYHMFQRSLSSGSASPSLGFDLHPSPSSGETGVSSSRERKRSSRIRSTEEATSGDSFMHSSEGTSILDSPSTSDPYMLLQRQSSVGSFKQGSRPGSSGGISRSISSPADQMGRRCSSAGIIPGEVSPRNKSTFDFEDESEVSIASESSSHKRRKRSESVDSIKSASSSGGTMMPPPQISSSGDTDPSLGKPLMSPVSSNASSPRPLPSSSPFKSSQMSDHLSSSSDVKSKGNRTGVSSTASSKSRIIQLDIHGGQMTVGGGSTLISPASSGSGTKSGSGRSPKSLPAASGKPVSTSSGPKIKQGIGMKIKGASQVSSSTTSASYKSNTSNTSSPPVSSSSSNPFVSYSAGDATTSPPSSVSSSKPNSGNKGNQGIQQLPGLQPCPFGVKKRQGSLSAVIDKLSNKSTPGSSGEGSSNSSMTGPESSSPSSVGVSSNRPDSTASKTSKAGGVDPASGKLKRPSSSSGAETGGNQATFKATLSGSKLTISKKPSSTTSSSSEVSGSVKPGGVKVKPNAGKVASSGPSSSSPAGKVKVSSGLKKQSLPPGSRVSSSSQNNPVKASTKVTSSSSGSQTGSSGSSAILEEAIPRLRLDQLPRIPKAERSQQQQQSQMPSSSAPPPPPSSQSDYNPLLIRRKSAQQQQYSQQQQSSSDRMPQPSFFPPSSDASQQQSGIQSPTEGPSEIFPVSKFQSNTISSSEVLSAGGFAREAASYLPTAVVSSSSVSSPPDSGAASSVLYTQPSTSTSTTVSSVSESPVVSGVNLSSTENKGVTSSSDAPDSPSSTPSSPVESAVISTVKAVPLIIPTESFDDPPIDSTGVNDGMISEDEDDDEGLVIDVDFAAASSPVKKEAVASSSSTNVRSSIDSSSEVSPVKDAENISSPPSSSRQQESLSATTPSTPVITSSSSGIGSFLWPTSSSSGAISPESPVEGRAEAFPEEVSSPSSSKQDENERESSQVLPVSDPVEETSKSSPVEEAQDPDSHLIQDSVDDALMDEALVPSSEPQL